MVLVPLLNPKFAIGLAAWICEPRVRGTSTTRDLRTQAWRKNVHEFEWLYTLLDRCACNHGDDRRVAGTGAGCCGWLSQQADPPDRPVRGRRRQRYLRAADRRQGLRVPRPATGDRE